MFGSAGFNVPPLSIIGDSKLVIEQMRGNFAMTSSRLAVFKKRANLLIDAARRDGIQVSWRWTPRDKNVEADALVNEVLVGLTDRVTIQRCPSGRNLLLDDCKRFFGISVSVHPPSQLRGRGFVVYAVPFFLQINDKQTLPSIERRLWREIQRENQRQPVILAYRPYGNRTVPISVRRHGDLTAGHRPVENDGDGGMELMLAFADSIIADEAPQLERYDFDRDARVKTTIYGYGGSRVLVLRGTWIPARDLGGILSYRVLDDEPGGYRIGG